MLSLPLHPDKRNPYRWWETFWGTQPDRFGEPSKSLLRLVDLTPSGHQKRAVDIGSGNGRYAVELAKLGFDTDALEWTGTGTNEIRRRAELFNVPLNCIEEDFLAIADDHRNYDLVLSSGFLEEIPGDSHELAVRGHINWTRRGGQILVRYCPEIAERGRLVDSDVILRLFRSTSTEITHFSEDTKTKLGRSGMRIRTATLAARKL